jgi:hypothetical protein
LLVTQALDLARHQGVALDLRKRADGPGNRFGDLLAHEHTLRVVLVHRLHGRFIVLGIGWRGARPQPRIIEKTLRRVLRDPVQPR